MHEFSLSGRIAEEGKDKLAAYYNEIDPFSAQWLRELIKAGLIAPGDVDERDIRDVTPDEVRGYTQCHFFAGIGVWSYALRRAGWPDEEPAWTGSCPCQPFSTAGKRSGTSDERHLWPSFFHLIENCQPPIVFGEQVASKDGLAWLDLVQTDMEGADYSVWPFDLCAAGFGAPHLRQRLYFVADSTSVRFEQRRDTKAAPIQGERPQRAGQYTEPGSTWELQGRPEGLCRTGDRVGYSTGARSTTGLSEPLEWQEGDTGVTDYRMRQRAGESPAFDSILGGYWRPADWLWCRDQKYRPVEPGTFPLVDGSPASVGRLRGYGNALVAEQATEFIAAYRSSLSHLGELD